MAPPDPSWASLQSTNVPITLQLTDVPIFRVFTTTWAARGNTARVAFFIGGVSPDNPPTDADLRDNDVWLPSVPAGTNYVRTNGAWAPTIVSPPPPATARPFNVSMEFLHDGGQDAVYHTQDLGIPNASFRAILTTSESNYLQTHHSEFFYYAMPYDLIRAVVETDPMHTATRDDNYRATMAALVASFGIGGTYLLFAPEWDNNPGNNYWAQNRFLEAGSVSNPNVPEGLTRQQAYDQFIHFYTANNHGGNTNHHQLGQLLSVPYSTRGYKMHSMNVYAGTVHYAFEMGVDHVVLERNNDDISGLVGGLAFIRGAGGQYNKLWGIDMSHWRSNGPHVGVTDYSGSSLISGWSNSSYRRHFYLSFFGGADTILLEGVNLNLHGSVNINGRTYTPLATEIKNFNDFAFTRHAARGVPHVPVAVMKDHITAWEPRWGLYNQGRYVWYAQMAANAGENMLHNLWDWIYPNYATWGSSETTTEPWGSGRWGEQFDIITERITGTRLQSYPAVILSMNAVMDSNLQALLDAYVRAGGIAVINAKQLSTGAGTQAHEALTGIHLNGTASASGTITWDGTPSGAITGHPTYNYSVCTLGTATNLAHSSTNTTQVARNVLGSGEVWTVMPDYMSDAANTALLGIGSKIIDVLTSTFSVMWITGQNHADIDYCITTAGGSNQTATVVCIANNSPAGTNWTGTVNFPGVATPVREWVTDTTPTFTTVGGNTQVSAAVNAGDVRVYAVG